MNEYTDQIGKFTIHIKCEEVMGDYAITISYDDTIIREETLQYSYLYQAVSYATGFIEGVKNSKQAVLSIINSAGDFLNGR